MHLATRTIIGVTTWAVASTTFLLIQQWADAGNWEVFVFPAVVAILGIWSGSSLETRLLLKLLFLGGFVTAISYSHLLQIEYLYLVRSNFFDPRNWAVYTQAFAFVSGVAFAIAALCVVGLHLRRPNCSRP